MIAARAPRTVVWAIGLLWLGMPFYPSFISLLPIAPPGVSLLGPPAALTLLCIVGILTVYLARELVRAARTALFSDPLVRAMGVYLASWAIPSMLGLVPMVGLVFCAISCCTCIGATALRYWARDPAMGRTSTWAILIGNACASTLALACWWTRTPAALYAIGNGRAIGSFVVPGELAGYLGMFLPFVAALAVTGKTRTMRVFAGVVAVLDVAATLASFSRAGIAGLCIACLVFCAIRRPAAIPWLLGVAALGGVALVRFINLHHNPAENFNRLSIWHAALRSIVLFPLWGVGPGGFARIYPLVKLPQGEPTAFHAHSFLLTTWAETGLIGVYGLACLWFTFFRIARARFAGATHDAQLVATTLFAGFLATWLQSSIDVVQILFLGLWVPCMGMTLLTLEERAG